MARGRNPSLLVCEKAEQWDKRGQIKGPLLNFVRMEGKEELEQKTRGVREVGALKANSVPSEPPGKPSPQKAAAQWLLQRLTPALDVVSQLPPAAGHTWFLSLPGSSLS